MRRMLAELKRDLRDERKRAREERERERHEREKERAARDEQLHLVQAAITSLTKDLRRALELPSWKSSGRPVSPSRKGHASLQGGGVEGGSRVNTPVQHKHTAEKGLTDLMKPTSAVYRTFSVPTAAEKAITNTDRPSAVASTFATLGTEKTSVDRSSARHNAAATAALHPAADDGDASGTGLSHGRGRRERSAKRGKEIDGGHRDGPAPAVESRRHVSRRRACVCLCVSVCVCAATFVYFVGKQWFWSQKTYKSDDGSN